MSLYQIAGVNLNVSCDVPWPLDSVNKFTIKEKFHEQDEWQIVRADLPLCVPDGRILFDSSGSWASYATPDVNVTDFVQYAVSGSERVAQGRMQIDDKSRLVQVNWLDEMGWTFPFDELFFLNAFALSKTILIHSLSVVVQNKGFLFCGVSGAGKSTLGQILEKSKFECLCDERNAISLRDDKIILSSTPFYGTSEKAEHGEAPLKAVVLLNPAHNGCSLSKISIETALSNIFPTVFLPQFSRSKIDSSLDLLDEIIGRVPVFQLNYDKSVTDITSFLTEKLFSQL